jgi:hypothetical protein
MVHIPGFRGRRANAGDPEFRNYPDFLRINFEDMFTTLEQRGDDIENTLREYLMIIRNNEVAEFLNIPPFIWPCLPN